MSIEMVFDLFLTDEYNREVKVTSKVNNYKELRKVGMLYNVCEFILGEYDVPMTLSQDGIARIRVTRKINGVDFSDVYLIDDMVKTSKSAIKIVGKTEGALLLEPYSYPSTATVNYSTYNSLFAALFGGVEHWLFLSNLPNVTNYYEIKNRTNGNVILSLAEKFGIDVYVKSGKIVLEPIKTISLSSVPKIYFNQTDVTYATLANKKGIPISKITINESASEILSTPSLKISSTLEPQPLSPTVLKTWVDPTTGSIFTKPPIAADILVLFSPINENELPIIKGAYFYRDNYFYAVEEFSVIDSDTFTLSGGIDKVHGITILNEAETEGVFPPKSTYENTTGGEVLEFTAMPISSSFDDVNGTIINIIDSGIDQPISSQISANDPFIYDVYLGSMENVLEADAGCTVTIQSSYSFDVIVEVLVLVGLTPEDTLNGHNIKVDGTGAIQTSGYAYSAGETIFYFDPEKVYDSIAKDIFETIVKSIDLPYSAELGDYQTNVELKVKREIQTSGTFSGGVTGIYYGQRDNKALTEFIRTDPNSAGRLEVSPSSDISNPTAVNPQITTVGGVGSSENIVHHQDFSYADNHNVIVFDENITGTVRIAYQTTAFKTRVPPTSIEKSIPIYATYKGVEAKFVHHIQAIDYFPINYKKEIAVAPLWNMPAEDAKNISGTIVKVNYYSGAETAVGTWSTDITGLATIVLGGYGQYGLKLDGYPTMYIKYFANQYNISFDKLIIEQIQDPGEVC